MTHEELLAAGFEWDDDFELHEDHYYTHPKRPFQWVVRPEGPIYLMVNMEYCIGAVPNTSERIELLLAAFAGPNSATPPPPAETATA